MDYLDTVIGLVAGGALVSAGWWLHATHSRRPIHWTVLASEREGTPVECECGVPGMRCDLHQPKATER